MYREEICKELLDTAKQACREGLMTATSGNLSYYLPELGKLVITPSAVPYDRMQVEDLVWINLQGEVLEATVHKPSSEWRMHTAIYQHCPEVQAIVHTHAPNATAFAALRQPIPCLLVETLLFLGGKIEVAPYAAQGSEEVGLFALPILKRKPVCLLANHGTVSVGTTLAQAFSRTQYMEDSAKIVRMAMSTGLPLPEEIGEK